MARRQLPQLDDDFEPDDFEADDDDFEADDFELDSPVATKPGSDLTRPDTSMFSIDPSWWEERRQRLANQMATSSLPDWMKPGLATLQQIPLEILRSGTELFSQPESVVTPSIIRGISRTKAAAIPEVLAPEVERPIRGLLGQGRYVAGPGGIQKEALLNPQEEARLLGYEPVVPKEEALPVIPGRNRFTDLDEAIETRRQGDTFYTGHEQGGGTSLELPDVNMPIPAQAGDERLGFLNSSQADLPYPLNIAPELVRPRQAQTQIRALAGDDFARQVLPDEPSITFENELLRPKIEPQAIDDLAGGTAALRQNEPILPSAPPKPKRATPHAVEAEKETNLFADKADAFIGKNIPELTPEIAPITNNSRSLLGRVADGLFISGERQLQKMGPIGDEIRNVLSTVEFKKRELFNEFAQPFINATKRLSPEEVDNFVSVMDGTDKPLTPNVAAIAEEARKVTNLMADLAQRAGVRIKTPDGKVAPFMPVKNYWPHRPVNPINRSTFIEELMKRNPKLSRGQAEKLAKQFQSESEWFNSPQHSRQFGKFEFRRDLNAMVDHMADMSDIIARAEILGPGDISRKGTLISNLIEKTPNPSKALELTRTHLRGGLDKNSQFYQAVKSINNVATKFQVFTKLGMFPISNLNNQLQTMLYGNLGDFGKSFAQAIVGSPSLKKMATEYGTIAIGDIPAGILSEAGKKQVPIVGGMVKWADDFARLVATGTGKGTAQSLFKAAQDGDRLAVRKLQNLLLENDMSEILKQPKLTEDQLKYATQRFVELAQQLNSNVKLPPAWVDEPLLHIPLIFKRFSFQGTKSVKDAIMQDPKRNIPMFLIMSPLLGELTGDLKSLVYGVIRGFPAPDGMLEAIAFELAGRHKFVDKLSGLDSEESDLSWLVNRLTADILQSWGLGLVADMLQGALGGKNAGYSALFGPAIDQALSLVSSIGTGDLEGLGREVLRSTPIIGPGIQRRLLPTPSQVIE